MKQGQTVVITSPLHAYRGHTGTITKTAVDEDGEMIFICLTNGHQVMLEPQDVKVRG